MPTPALSIANPGGVRNKVVNIQDVISILFYVGTIDGNVANANGVVYNNDLNANGIFDGVEYDRSPSSTPGKPWRSGPPNKVVSIADALIALNQVGMNCANPP